MRVERSNLCDARSIDVYIRRLREKIEIDPASRISRLFAESVPVRGAEVKALFGCITPSVFQRIRSEFR